MQDMHDDTNPRFMRQVTILRHNAGTWICRLRTSRLEHEHAGSSPYPLPQGFPFGPFSLQENIRWQDDDGSNIVRHDYPTQMIFQGLPNVTNGRGWDPFVWQVYSGEVVLGHVELDARLFFDEHPFLSWNADFVLESMKISLDAGRELRISCRIAEEAADFRTQIYEIRTFQGDLINDLGRRQIPKRDCAVCRRWLPPSGPPRCLNHWK